MASVWRSIPLSKFYRMLVILALNLIILASSTESFRKGKIEQLLFSPVPNQPQKTMHLSAECGQNTMRIIGNFSYLFKGRIYSADYADEPECGFNASILNSFIFSFLLPIDECGIKMTVLNNDLENDLMYEVVLYIQHSAFLQQAIDQRVILTCNYVAKSHLESNDKLIEVGLNKKGRSGRGMSGRGRNLSPSKSSLKVGEALMEILPGKDPQPKNKKNEAVGVGDDVSVVITTKVSRGYDARVVNCTAHDGSKSSQSDSFRSQPLINSAGCSVDTFLLPNLRKRRLSDNIDAKISHLHFATFPAFKFPEREHLHLKCEVVYCAGPCPQVSCGEIDDSFENIFNRKVVERTSVGNSIHVTSPQLESQNGHGEGTTVPVPLNAQKALDKNSPSTGYYAKTSLDKNTKNSKSTQSLSQNVERPEKYSKSDNDDNFDNNDKNERNGTTICISPSTIIIILVVLGCVLVVSITITLWYALKRREAQKISRANSLLSGSNPYLHNSVFSNGSTTTSLSSGCQQPAPYYRFAHW